MHFVCNYIEKLLANFSF